MLEEKKYIYKRVTFGAKEQMFWSAPRSQTTLTMGVALDIVTLRVFYNNMDIYELGGHVWNMPGLI